MGLNLHLLRIFLGVGEQRGFSRAARSLHISQSAVSKAVRQLEYELDLILIERGAGGAKGSKGVRLTDSGNALFEHARGIFALERAAADDVRARVGLERGQLTVGASTTVAGYWIPAYVASFLQQHPSIELQLRVGNTQAMSQALLDCEVEVALVEGAVEDPRIVATHWRDDELQIISHPTGELACQRELSAADLNQQLWWVRERGSGTREATERLMKAHAIEPVRTIELCSNEGIARAVAAGSGAAMLPSRVVRELTMLGELRVVPFPKRSSLTRPLFLLRLEQRALSHVARAFCAILQEPPANQSVRE